MAPLLALVSTVLLPLDGVASADTGRPPPDHVVVPVNGQLFLQGQLQLPHAVANHVVDDVQSLLALFRVLKFHRSGD